MSLLSFERTGSTSQERANLLRELAEIGIRWRALRYHKRPSVLSTAYDVAHGLVSALWDVSKGVRLIHARSHVPALVGYVVQRLTGVPFLFDHRGLMAEEFVDGGIWSRTSWQYRMTRWWEDRFLHAACGVVVLSNRYRRELATRDGVSVIPCAVDLSSFYPASAADDRPFELVYAGSWSGLYLADEMLRFFEVFREMRPQARFLVLVPEGQPLPDARPGVEARHARPEHVPALVRQARAGLSFRRRGRAQVAASPVKVGEYWATGLPVVSSVGIGDLDDWITDRQVGVILPGTSIEEMLAAAEALCRLLQEGSALTTRCRRLAEDHYRLETAIAAYDSLYRHILRGGGLA